MAEIKFDRTSIESNRLTFLTDATLDRLRQLLVKHHPELKNKRLLIYLSKDLLSLFEVVNYPLHLLIYWQPRDDCELLVKYRTRLAYSTDDDAFLPPIEPLSIDFEIGKTAPEQDVLNTLLEFGIVKRGQPGVQPDHSQKHSTFFVEEALLVPIGHNKESIDLAFSHPRALLLGFHPLCSKNVRNYLWYDNETIRSLALEFYGSLTEPEEQLLMVKDSEPSVSPTLEIKDSDFPKFPETPPLPDLGLLEAQVFQLEASGLEAEGFRLGFEMSSSAFQQEEVVVFKNYGHNGSSFFEVSERDWLNLKRLASDEQTWSPPAFTGSCLRGGKWQLEWWRPPEHIVMSSILPPVGPFWDLYIAILDLSGLEYFLLNEAE